MGLVEDPGIDLIVELIGGVEPALSLIRRALELGKPVVTANKEVLAKHGDALFQKSLDAALRLASKPRLEAAFRSSSLCARALLGTG